MKSAHTKINFLSQIISGEKCPCGAWVAPAFHIDSGKVDKIPSQHVIPSSHSSTSARIQPTSPPHPPGGTTATGRPLSYVPLPERSSSAASGRKVDSPVAAVQPRVATSAAATVIRGGSMEPQGIFASSSASSALRSSTGFYRGQNPGIQRAAATVAPLQSMDLDNVRDGVENFSENNRDLESGINSIHMDVDS